MYVRRHLVPQSHGYIPSAAASSQRSFCHDSYPPLHRYRVRIGRKEAESVLLFLSSSVLAKFSSCSDICVRPQKCVPNIWTYYLWGVQTNVVDTRTRKTGTAFRIKRYSRKCQSEINIWLFLEITVQKMETWTTNELVYDSLTLKNSTLIYAFTHTFHTTCLPNPIAKDNN